MEDGAFDLDADEASAVREGEIEGGGVSPWLGDDEAEFGGTGHETEFGPFASLFGVANVHPEGFSLSFSTSSTKSSAMSGFGLDDTGPFSC